jgi:hypothetical protein
VSAVRDAPFEEVPLGYFARKIPIQLFNYFTCKIFIAKELRQSGMQGAAGHKTSLYLIACLLGLSPSGGWASIIWGNLALTVINRICPGSLRPDRPVIRSLAQRIS